LIIRYHFGSEKGRFFGVKTPGTLDFSRQNKKAGDGNRTHFPPPISPVFTHFSESRVNFRGN